MKTATCLPHVIKYPERANVYACTLCDFTWLRFIARKTIVGSSRFITTTLTRRLFIIRAKTFVIKLRKQISADFFLTLSFSCFAFSSLTDSTPKVYYRQNRNFAFFVSPPDLFYAALLYLAKFDSS